MLTLMLMMVRWTREVVMMVVMIMRRMMKQRGEPSHVTRFVFASRGALMDLIWAVLGLAWVGQSWGSLGALFCHPGALLGRLGASWVLRGRLGGLLWPSWTVHGSP
eukprot:8732629-Pyramimonas_sp.AAC.1